MKTDIPGIILAGGKSSRMGFPKAFLSVNGRRIIDIILEVFHRLFEEILIVTDNKDYFVEFKDVNVIQDLVNGFGPLGGIYTGLKAISTEKAFFIACDMPLLSSDLIERLLSASSSDYDCIVPYSQKGEEPLFAVYSIKVLPIIEDLLKKEDLSLNQLLKRSKCRFIKLEDKDLSSLFNVNTPEEFIKLLCIRNE